jgi:hypothetical protein
MAVREAILPGASTATVTAALRQRLIACRAMTRPGSYWPLKILVVVAGLLLSAAAQKVLGSPAGLIVLVVYAIAGRHLIQRYYWPRYRQR